MPETRPDPRPFWRKPRFLRLLLGLALANIVVYGAVTYRLATKQERLTQQQASLSQEIATRQAELASLREEQERIERNDAVAEQFWSEVVKPLTPGLTDALAEIDRLARQSNVERGRTSYSQEVLDVGLTEMNVSMPLQGDYFDLIRFINVLERSERFFLVREIALRDAAEGQLSLRCDLSFFVKPPSETAAVSENGNGASTRRGSGR
ncbi:MAG: type 4a pilus biogenesis protein PilO [Vicinamibacteria bacterium]